MNILMTSSFYFCFERGAIYFFLFHLLAKQLKHKDQLLSKKKRMQMQFVLKQIHTGLLPFVLLLQHPMRGMYQQYIPLLFFVVCYLSTAHMFCATKKKNVQWKLRLGHAFARLVSRSFVLLLWYCAIFLVATPTKKHCGSYTAI